jgi:hypothetical protein
VASHQYDSTVRCAGKTVRSVQIVASSSEAVAFRKAKGRGPYPDYVTYACMRRSGPINRLKRSEISRSSVRPLLAGRYVAYRQLFFLGEHGSASGFVVLDMRTGTTTLESPPDNSSLIRYVVKRNGSAAWIDIPEDSNEGRVWKADRTTAGAPQQIDSSSELGYDSLRLTGDRRQVLWTKAGAQQSAPID